MAVLAALCGLLGLFPGLVAPLLDRAVASWAVGGGGPRPLMPPIPALASLAPLTWVSAAGVGLLSFLVVLALILRTWLRTRPVARAVTWDCGYVAPSATMQYTSSSFAEMLVGLFAWVLRPKVQRPPRSGLFEPSGSFSSHVPDVVLDGALLPALAGAERLTAKVHVLHQGRIQAYVLYVFLALLGLLLWL